MNDDNILAQINLSALKFLEPLTSGETYKRVVEEAQKLVSAEYGSLYLEEAGKLKRAYSTLPVAKEIHIRQRGFTYQSFKRQEAFVKDWKQFGRIHPQIKELGVKSNIFIPLSYKKKSVGVLVVNSSTIENFKENEFNVLKLFGSLVTLAVRKTQLYAETKSALKTRDLFISLASHELRTPLTSINGYAQLLNNCLSNTPQKAEAGWASELVKECRRLNSLVGELLTANLIRGQQLKFTLREQNIKEILKQSMEEFAFTHPSRPVVFKNGTSDNQGLIVGDHDKLVQVMVNLLDNAAKFSPENSGITIHLKNQFKNLVIIVEDHGKGIPSEDQKRIFDSFFKGSNYNQEKGMGLGLFLAKHIIDKHHGSIKIKSKENIGTKVEISLPKL